MPPSVPGAARSWLGQMFRSMGPVSGRQSSLLWDVAAPTRPSELPGVAMAGFTDTGVARYDLRLIPHPAVTLIVIFAGDIAVDDAAGRCHRGSFVTGTGFGEVMRARRAMAFRCLQVRLAPVVAHALLGPAVAELSGVVDADDVLGSEAALVSGRLADLDDWQDRFAWMEHWLASKLTGRVDPEVAWVWRRIRASRGRTRVEPLAAEVGWSRKRLWARFQSQLGIPPKRAATLVRFDHAVHQLVAGRSPATVAAECGYVDQSHLHREVVAFTGRTPAAVVDEPFLAVDDIAWGRPG